MKQLKVFSALLLSALVIASCYKNKDYNYNNPPPSVQSTVVKATGDSAAVATAIDQFRPLLGDPVNNAPGQTVGRREIGWDGVPANFTNNNNFPLDFFNSTDPTAPNGRKRGLVYLNASSPIRIDSSDFVDLDASYGDQFNAFSKKKSLISATSNITEIGFKVAGTNTDAFVKGFGLVFSDVDDANYTTVEYFNGNKSLGVFKVPATSGAGSFSFLGVRFPDEKVTRVKITCGNGVLGAGIKDVSNGGNKDLVVMDDFFYDEPSAVN